MNDAVAPQPQAGACPDPESRVEATVGDRVWLLDRPADMEALWAQMDGDDLGDDERLPYWAEVWPASVMVGRHILRNRLQVVGQACLDVGCGLGLTGMIGASVGARVAAFDYEWSAVSFARRNAALNGVAQPLWLQMDWRRPAVAAGAFEFIWGGDVLYEKRFFGPLIRLFRRALAPGGRIWLGEPVRTVSRPVWDELRSEGFAADKIEVDKVALCGQEPTVNLWELRME